MIDLSVILSVFFMAEGLHSSSDSSASSLFVSLQTTATLTRDRTCPFESLLHGANDVLRLIASPELASQSTLKYAVDQLQQIIARNEDQMHGNSKNIAFFNFCKSFAAAYEMNSMQLPIPSPNHGSTPSQCAFSQLPTVPQEGYRTPNKVGSHHGPPSPDYKYSPIYGNAAVPLEPSTPEKSASTSMMGTMPQAYAHVSSGFSIDLAERFAASFASPPLKKVKQEIRDDDEEKKSTVKTLEIDQCPFCQFKSSCSAHVTKHVRMEHPKNWINFSSFACSKCDYRCRSIHTFRKHERAVHIGVWEQWIEEGRLCLPPGSKCPFCSLLINRIDDMGKHAIDSHLGDISSKNPYIGCNECTETFNWVSDLYQHWIKKNPCRGKAKLLPLPSKPKK